MSRPQSQMLSRQATAAGASFSAEIVHAWGSACASGIRGGAQFGDDAGNYVVHPVGRHVTVRQVETSEVSVLTSQEHVEAVTCCTINSSRTFFAAGERWSEEPLARISVYDTRSVNVGRPPTFLFACTAPCARFVCATFSYDDLAADDKPSYLIAVSGGAEASLVVFDIAAQRQIAKCKVDGAADKVCFCPAVSALMISVSGPHVFRLAQLRNFKTESSLKLMPTIEGLEELSFVITDHAWIEATDGLVVVTTAEGPVHIVSSQELSVVRTIQQPFGSQVQACPHCVRPFSQGFLLGGSDSYLAAWEASDSIDEGDPSDATAAEEFRHVGSVRVRDSEAAIYGIDLSGGEESILVAFRNADIAVTSMAAIYAGAGEDVPCSLLSGGYHSGPVTGLDLAAQRPIVVTICKKDASVRIWNHVTRICELRVEFPGDPPTGVAMHPFGYFLALTFLERLRLYYILAGELKLHCEFGLRHVKPVKFSHGGHLLAAVQGMVVHIFSTQTLTKVITLQGHVKPVTTLCFDPEDQSLWTFSGDGTMIEWNTATWSQVEEKKGRLCECVASSSSGPSNTVLSMARGKTVLQHISSEGVQEQELPFKHKLASLAHFPGLPVLFAGTSVGTLQIWSNPCPTAMAFASKAAAAAAAALAMQFVEIGLHVGGCSGICLSVDGRTLVSAGEDGAIFVLNVIGLVREDFAVVGGDAEIRSMSTEVALVNKSEVLRLAGQCRLLQAEQTALKATLLEAAERLEAECVLKVREARQKDQTEITELTRRCNALEQASVAKDRESQRIMSSMEKSHIEAADQLQTLYEKKVVHEADRLVEMEITLGLVEEETKEVSTFGQEQLQQMEEEAARELEAVLREKDLEIQKHKDLIAFSQYRFVTMLDQQGDENQAEIIDLQVDLTKALERQRHSEVQLRKEQGVLLSGLEIMEKNCERIEKERQETQTSIKGLKEQTEELARTLVNLKHEGKEREATLQDQELKLQSCKMKVRALKKFKLVLDKRLTEVTASMQPKDQLIDELRNHLRELESEFEKQLVQQRSMEGLLEQKKQRVYILAEECKQIEKKIEEKEQVIARFRADLHELVSKQKDERLWPQEIRKLYQTHVLGDPGSGPKLPIEEMQRQMRAVERKVTSLAVRSGQMKSTCKSDMQRKAHENALLVHELNKQRVQKSSLQNQVKLLQSSLQDAERRYQALHSGNAAKAIADCNPSPPITVPAAALSVLRSPSGTLPGPRQRAASAPTDPKNSSHRAKVLPLASPGTQLASPAKVSLEDQRRIQALLATADLNRQQLEVQQSENKRLRGKIEELLTESSNGERPR